MEQYTFILASASPDRKRLLEQLLNISFITIPSYFDESKIFSSDPTKQAKALAHAKAWAVFKQLGKPHKAIIMGADTLVAYNKEIIGKATNTKQAKAIITKLSGSWHTLITGFCILKSNAQHHIHTEAIATKVFMRKVSPEELQIYLDSGGWKNKAGAYGIQQEAKDFIHKIKGCYLNVVGLPLCHISQVLKKCNYPVDQQKIKTICQKINRISCSVTL